MSVENKAEIRRKIISALGLEYWEVEGFFFDPSISNIQSKINLFVESFPLESKKILNLSFTGFGPGEILLYFLCDNLYLSGFKSQIDAHVNGKPLAEIKAVRPSNKQHWYYDFRFGAEASGSNYQFLAEVRNFVNHTNNPALLENELEITRTKISELRRITLNVDEFSLNLKIINGEIYSGNSKICKRSDIDFSSKIQEAFNSLSSKTPNYFKEIEDKYFDSIINSSIGNHNFIFFDRTTARCVYFGKIIREMLSIERVTQGKIKPFIKLIT